MTNLYFPKDFWWGVTPAVRKLKDERPMMAKVIRFGTIGTQRSQNVFIKNGDQKIPSSQPQLLPRRCGVDERDRL